MITKEDIEKLASLGRLKLSPAEKETLRKDLSSVLTYIDEIKAVSAKKLVRQKASYRNILRLDADPHRGGEFSSALVKAAPASLGGFLKVKKIL